MEKDVDAVYMTYNSLNTKHLRRVMEPLIKARIPIFSQTGSREVKMGALASVTSYSAEEGRFVADLLRRLLDLDNNSDRPSVPEIRVPGVNE